MSSLHLDNQEGKILVQVKDYHKLSRKWIERCNQPDGKIFEARYFRAAHDVWFWIGWQFLSSICVHPIKLNKEPKEDSMPQVWLPLILPKIWLIAANESAEVSTN